MNYMSHESSINNQIISSARNSLNAIYVNSSTYQKLRSSGILINCEENPN